VTKDEKTLELVRRAVEIFKIHVAPVTLNEPASITAYYAVFNSPAIWKPGTRTPQEMLAPAVKMSARFKRSFGS
jgi:hypothetical protein